MSEESTRETLGKCPGSLWFPGHCCQLDNKLLSWCALYGRQASREIPTASGSESLGFYVATLKAIVANTAIELTMGDNVLIQYRANKQNICAYCDISEDIDRWFGSHFPSSFFFDFSACKISIAVSAHISEKLC
jgi:hypothetical protein